MELTPIDKLDKVLDFLATDSNLKHVAIKFEDLEGWLLTKGFKFRHNELSRILDKLNQDKFVDYKKLNEGTDKEADVILISFDGEVFNEQGGYRQMLLNASSEKIKVETLASSQQELSVRLNRLTGWIATGTILLALGTFALALLEYLHLATEHHWFPFCK